MDRHTLDRTSDAQWIALLRQARTIAVVGLSPKPERASHRVAAYMQQVGFTIIPVRPAAETILGEPCFPSLDDIPEDVTVDVVNVFRKAADTPAVAEAAVRLTQRQRGQGAKLFWLQTGILNDAAMTLARNGGWTAVQDLCLMIEHQRLARHLA